MKHALIFFVLTFFLFGTPALASEYGDGMTSKLVYMGELEAKIKALSLQLENLKKEKDETESESDKKTPTCSLTTDKPVYELNEEILLTVYSSNAKYARFLHDRTTKRSLTLPKGKVPAFGAYSIKANVAGEQTLVFKVTSKNRKSATCRASVVVSK